MNLINMSRELLAQEVRELAPVVLVGATLVFFMLVGYFMARIQMANKYSKKNMPVQAKKHVNYLALKLRVTEVARDKLELENESLNARLRGIASLVLPQNYVTKELEDDAVGNPTVVKLVKNSTKKLKLVK